MLASLTKRLAFFKRLGPGFVTGASDDDPAAIGTYVQAGAQFGCRTRDVSQVIRCVSS